MAVPVADEFAAIRERAAAIRAAEVQRCPTYPERTLHDCLRWTYESCGMECPHKGGWVGPEK